MNETSEQRVQTRPGMSQSRWLLLIAVIGVAAYAMSLHRSSSSTSDWPADFEQARQAASAAGKPLLIQFSSPGCPYCVRMEREVLSRQDVADALVPFQVVSIDAWKNEDLAARFDIEGVPVYKVLSPAGQLVAQADGYVPADDFIAFLKRAAQRASSVAGRTSSPVH